MIAEALAPYQSLATIGGQHNANAPPSLTDHGCAQRRLHPRKLGSGRSGLESSGPKPCKSPTTAAAQTAVCRRTRKDDDWVVIETPTGWERRKWPEIRKER